MQSLKTFSGALGPLAFAILAPNLAFATQDPYAPTAQAIPVDLGDDTTTLTAHATTPNPAGGAVDDACRQAAKASSGEDGGTIVVCSHGGDGESQRVSPSKSVDESTRDGALHAPDVSGIPGCLGPCITIPFGHVPPPVYYIDLKSIPEAPKNSDAWKIGQGEQRAP
ncbi:hypothetical protein [Novosphingobium sp. 9]|uniref:hypothetical protein n=1 Tax=Novosphingobium sp. 9 TaxID=2025349 RepID=UPI0021B4FAF0|nr:hypothetical protein [Novosphingobium sp. 9]